MSILETIAAQHPTDKLSVHSYLPFYELLFTPLQERAHPVLEIGVDGGGSLCIWREFFTTAPIWGFDINPCPPYLNDKTRVFHNRTDAYSAEGFTKARSIGPFTAIIDDGPHSIESQRQFCTMYPNLLAPDGVAIIEDVQDINQCPSLAASLPEGFHHATVDLRSVKGRYDDVLFAIWRK